MAALLAVDARESSQTGRQLGFFKAMWVTRCPEDSDNTLIVSAATA